ncbi:hypothetical protein [Flavobacterium agrisoli]|uniref:Uncharacterized protein n=1 Tax=Flavobacterium agrisoli TaxID=2793066 RepID=A0A934PMY3_9FLAO|nr:hypothetical protein [Flavobacterium agrisoli]MBK0371171.1 hypothetical protein [Flavobacterium agrisoli]
MKTKEKLLFPKLENEFLDNLLGQLVNKHNVIQMFFTKNPSSKFSYLIIHIESSIDAKQLQQNKWVSKVRRLYQIVVLFIYSTRLHHRFSLGDPFIELYCQSSAVIYQNNGFKNSLVSGRNWEKYKKRFNTYKDRFHHDHNLYKSHIQNLISEGSSNSIFTSYERLIGFDLDYLEELYCGNKSGLSLGERITNLIEYVPVIQKYFVRSSYSNYYLTDLFKKAKEATDDDELIYRDEMYEAVGIAQQKIFHLIEERFEELKKNVKKIRFEKHAVLCQTPDKSKDIILSAAIEAILNSTEVEEIYLFHQVTYGERISYYLMLIVTVGNNEKIKSISESLKYKTGDKYNFVLLSHSRYWIQKNLYQYQSFFVSIVKNEYLIYSASKYFAEFHWETNHDPYHADLYFYYTSTKNTASQFYTIVNNAEENYQGLDTLFTLFFISFCRTYIFVKTYYLPNDLSNQSLWQLCVYADSDIRKYDYLLEQFWTDFFPYLDKNMRLYHKLIKLNKDEVNPMNIIIDKLMNELDNLIIKGGVLSNFEQN